MVKTSAVLEKFPNLIKYPFRCEHTVDNGRNVHVWREILSCKIENLLLDLQPINREFMLSHKAAGLDIRIAPRIVDISVIGFQIKKQSFFF